ncbi:hypothetical protein D9M72_586550 [compost metagenome]
MLTLLHIRRADSLPAIHLNAAESFEALWCQRIELACLFARPTSHPVVRVVLDTDLRHLDIATTAFPHTTLAGAFLCHSFQCHENAPYAALDACLRRVLRLWLASS